MIETVLDLKVGTLIHDIQEATARSVLKRVKAYIIRGWPHKKKMWHKTYKHIVPSGISWP